MPPLRIVFWVSTLGALALVARSLVFEAPAFSVACAALVAYLALVLLGVLVPKLEVFGDVFWHGPRDLPWVALTFDDGPDPETTPRVLEVLERRKVHATFFIIGRKAEQNPELVRALLAQGHELGLHGYAHDRLQSLRAPRTIARDIERSRAVLLELGIEPPVYFRPPIGHTSPRTVEGARRAGVLLVAWSVRAFDGRRSMEPRDVRRRVLSKVRRGSIVLLHDAAERGDFVPASVEALDGILEGLKERGLTCVTLTKMAERALVESR